MKVTPRTELLILNLLLLAVYFIAFSGLTVGISRETMFSTNDALSYLDVANLGTRLSGTDALAIRPFLYPLIVALAYKTLGAYGLWFLQFLFWLAAANFLFLSLKKLSNSILGFIAALLFAINLTCITLTLYALTEITTVMLLSFLLYFITHAAERRTELGFIHRLLLILVLLTVIKPLFYPVVLGVVFIVLPLFYYRQYRQHTKKLFTLLLVLSPLLLQQTFMKMRYGQFKVSMIGDITMRDYFLADGFAAVNKISRDSALIAVNKFEPHKVNSYILSHSQEFIEVYLTNLKNNCNGYPQYLDYPINTGNKRYIDFMMGMNDLYYQSHFILLPLLLLVLFLLARSRRAGDMIILLIPLLLSYYILLSSGISTYQGDRLTISAFPLWLFAYLLAAWLLADLIIRRIKKRPPSHSMRM
ncbi:MAG: hypothetical protein JWO09_2596 [Bacteroidetes bacterium]|nr:hypothetical protein [Bacteroidota bacterium]